MKKAIVSVTNDLSTDNRVLRSIGVLRDAGYQVLFVGRELPESAPTDFPFESKRFKLWFRAGFLFYAHYNLRLFWFLLWRKADLYWANDLDTLMPMALAAKSRKKHLVYDSHEYFCGVPEIQGRPLVMGIWQAIERIFLPVADAHITVNRSIAHLYRQEYGIDFKVVRNIGALPQLDPPPNRAALGLPEEAFLLINQGAGINVDRGMEEIIAALPHMPEDVHLLIVGNGDVVPQLKEQVETLNLEERVHFFPKQPYRRLLQYTQNADCGLSLDKDSNLNYRYSLPNKVFDYIYSGIPLLVSDLVEVASIVRKYEIGIVSPSHATPDLVASVQAIRNLDREKMRVNLKRAAAENHWAQERLELEAILQKLA